MGKLYRQSSFAHTWESVQSRERTMASCGKPLLEVRELMLASNESVGWLQWNGGIVYCFGKRREAFSGAIPLYHQIQFAFALAKEYA
jgi:hypothetical protein